MYVNGRLSESMNNLVYLYYVLFGCLENAGKMQDIKRIFRALDYFGFFWDRRRLKCSHFVLTDFRLNVQLNWLIYKAGNSFPI